MKSNLECPSCDTKYSVTYKCEEDVKEVDPIFCPFCGDEVVLEEEHDDDWDEDVDNDEFGFN